MRIKLTHLALGIGLSSTISPVALSQETLEGVRDIYRGENSPTAEDLAGRGAAQIASAKATLDVFYDFQLTDSRESSGITFMHRPTDAGLKDYEMVHYDHGNGLLIADVDGDDRYDLYFISQFGSNELWRNLGGGKFENITERAGVALADKICVTGAFADIDNDGDADLFVTSVRTGNSLFENDGTGKFRNISAAAGVDHIGTASAGSSCRPPRSPPARASWARPPTPPPRPASSA